MKKLFLLPLVVLCAACSSNKTKDAGPEIDPTGGFPVVPEGDPEAVDGGGGWYGAGKDGENGNPSIPAGQLTCSALNDNEHYDYWTSLAKSTQEGKGIFQEYKEKFAFNTFSRVDLTINNAKGATVIIEDDSFKTVVDNFDKAYLFPSDKKEEYNIQIKLGDKVMNKTVKDGDVIDFEDSNELSKNLQIMFVIDATGSMGDEMDYLKVEIDDVINEVKVNNPNSEVTLAIMMYRDEGDEYVVRYSEFTKDIASQQAFLKEQSANGGGDFEEAVQTALSEAMEKQWMANATKLLFHVADAPAHDEDIAKWNKASLLAASKGIKIITVASSGIDKKTEYFFRSQSLLTAGQYVYLTGHSGIGGEHLDATINVELTVEYLNACLIRLINEYNQGIHIEPVSIPLPSPSPTEEITETVEPTEDPIPTLIPGETPVAD